MPSKIHFESSGGFCVTNISHSKHCRNIIIKYWQNWRIRTTDFVQIAWHWTLHTLRRAGCALEWVKQNTKATSYKVFPQTLRFVERLFKVCTKSPDIIKPSKDTKPAAADNIDSMFFHSSSFLLETERPTGCSVSVFRAKRGDCCKL